MRKESQLLDTINTANQAKLIVEHPLFLASLELLREETIEKFERLEFGQALEMQECNVKLKLLGDFKANLINTIIDGDIANQVLTESNSNKQARK